MSNETSTRLHTTKCIYCEAPLSARSPEALMEAGKDHAAYVNTTADRTTDPHFEDMRLDALLAS